MTYKHLTPLNFDTAIGSWNIGNVPVHHAHRESNGSGVFREIHVRQHPGASYTWREPSSVSGEFGACFWGVF